MEEYKRLIGLFKQLKTETNDLYNQWYPERSDKTLFVDEIRKITKAPSNLDQMITYIKEAAKRGRHEAIFSRPTRNMELTEEAAWFRKEGFKVKEETFRHSCEYYPALIISWEI